MSYPPAEVQTVLPILPIPSLYGRGLDWLKAMVVNPAIALNYLEYSELHLTLRYLYQIFFPMEFNLSTASRYWEPEQHSEEELEFFGLIHDRLFFLPIEDNDSLCTGIPVYSINPDYWDEEYDWDELNALEQLLLGLAEDVEWGMVEQTFASLPFLTPISPNQVDWRLFEQNCKTAPFPFNYFHVAVQIFDRNTGNPFLDSYSYEYVDFWTWSVESIEELTQYYCKAIELQQQAQILADWLTDNPHRLLQLIELWNQSAKGHSISPSVKIIAASQLENDWSAHYHIESA